MRLFLGIVFSIFILASNPLFATDVRNLPQGVDCQGFWGMLETLDQGKSVSYACMDRSAEEVYKINDEAQRQRYADRWFQAQSDKNYNIILRNALGDIPEQAVVDYIVYRLGNGVGGVLKCEKGEWCLAEVREACPLKTEQYLQNISSDGTTLFSPGCYYFAMGKMVEKLKQDPAKADEYANLISLGKARYTREMENGGAQRLEYKWFWRFQSALIAQATNLVENTSRQAGETTGNQIASGAGVGFNAPAGGNGNAAGSGNGTGTGNGSGDGLVGAGKYASGKVRVRTN